MHAYVVDITELSIAATSHLARFFQKKNLTGSIARRIDEPDIVTLLHTSDRVEIHLFSTEQVSMAGLQPI